MHIYIHTHKHRVLAICNSVATVPDEEGDKIGEVRYEACSPDEEALVQSAAKMGVVLEHRGLGMVRVRVLGELERYRVLKELEFTVCMYVCMYKVYVYVNTDGCGT